MARDDRVRRRKYLGEPGVLLEGLDLVPERGDRAEARVVELAVVDPVHARDHKDDAIPPRIPLPVPEGMRRIDEVLDAVWIGPDLEVERRIEDPAHPDGAAWLAHDLRLRHGLLARSWFRQGDLAGREVPFAQTQDWRFVSHRLEELGNLLLVLGRGRRCHAFEADFEMVELFSQTITNWLLFALGIADLGLQPLDALLDELDVDISGLHGVARKCFIFSRLLFIKRRDSSRRGTRCNKRGFFLKKTRV